MQALHPTWWMEADTPLHDNVTAEGGSNMPTVLIIGASRGIRPRACSPILRRRLDGPCDGSKPIRRQPPSNPPRPARTALHPLKVTDRSHLNALTDALSETPFDVLIHNAGVFGKGMTREDVLAINAEAPSGPPRNCCPRSYKAMKRNSYWSLKWAQRWQKQAQ